MTPDREAMVQAVAEALWERWQKWGYNQNVATAARWPEGLRVASVAVDALAPFFAAAKQEGRNEAAAAIEARASVWRSSTSPGDAYDVNLCDWAARLARGVVLRSQLAAAERESAQLCAENEQLRGLVKRVRRALTAPDEASDWERVADASRFIDTAGIDLGESTA